jgi:hypothetical protein
MNFGDFSAAQRQEEINFYNRPSTRMEELEFLEWRRSRSRSKARSNGGTLEPAEP